METNNLQQYKILVDFLGKTLGPDFEVVLQDLTADNHSIIAIANGHISGRTIGSPLTNAALQMISTKLYEKNDYITNYRGITESGHILRSSTMFIKDSHGTPIGLLCINFDDSHYKELTQMLRSIIHPDTFGKNSLSFDKSIPAAEESSESSETITESFPMDIPSLMEKIFKDATTNLNTSADRLNQQERKEIMTTLNEQGLFQLKGAVPFVAHKFACSNASIYRYLSEITNE